MKRAVLVLAGASLLCLTACKGLDFIDKPIPSSTEVPETIKILTGDEIRERWWQGDEKSWLRGQEWGKHGVLTKKSRESLLDIAIGSDEEKAEKATNALIANAESARKEHGNLKGKDDNNQAKMQTKRKLQKGLSDVLQVAQRGKHTKKKAAGWLAKTIFSSDEDEQKIASDLVKGKTDLSPELRQALASKAEKNTTHAKTPQIVRVLADQTDLSDQDINALIRMAGDPNSNGQDVAMNKLQQPEIWDRIVNNDPIFKESLQTGLRSSKGDETDDSVNLELFLRLATEGKTSGLVYIPILQEISTSPHAGVQDAVVTRVLELDPDRAGHADLDKLKVSVVGSFGRAHTAVPENADRRTAIAAMVLRSNSVNLTKAVLDSADASKAMATAAENPGEQESLVTRMLQAHAAGGLSDTAKTNLHHLHRAIVGELGRPNMVVRRNNIAALAWNSMNGELAKAIWADTDARAAIVAAAGGGDHGQESLVSLMLKAHAAGLNQNIHNVHLHELEAAIVQELTWSNAPPKDPARRDNIGSLVWDSKNGELAKAILASFQASQAMAAAAGQDNVKQSSLVTLVLAAAAPAAGGLQPNHKTNLHELSDAIVAELKRLGGNADNIAELVWGSNNPTLAKAILKSPEASQIMAAAADTDIKKQRLVTLMLTAHAAGGLQLIHKANLHELSDAIVGALARAHAAAIAPAGDGQRRDNIAALVWNSMNGELAKAILKSPEASQAMAAAAGEDIKKQCLVTLMLTAHAAGGLPHQANVNLHEFRDAIVEELIVANDAVLAGGDAGRRNNIAALVWDSGNGRLAQEVLDSENARAAIVAAADADPQKQKSLVTLMLAANAVGLNAAQKANLYEFRGAIVGELGRLCTAAPLSADATIRRREITDIVLGLNNVNFTKEVLASTNASKAMAAAVGTNPGNQEILVNLMLAATVDPAAGLTGVQKANLHELSVAIVGELARAHAAIAPGGDGQRRDNIAALAWNSMNGELAKAILKNPEASQAMAAAADTDTKKQRLVSLMLKAHAAGLEPDHNANLHKLSVPVVAVLGQFGGGQAPNPLPPGAPMGLSRAGTASLVWDSKNAELAKAVLNSAAARAAIVAAAGTDGDKQDKLVLFALKIAEIAETGVGNCYYQLHNLSAPLVQGLARTHDATAGSLEAIRRDKIAALVWDSSNATLIKAILLNPNASRAMAAAAGEDEDNQEELVTLVLAAAAPAAGGLQPNHKANLHELSDAIVAELVRAAHSGIQVRRNRIANLVWDSNNAALAGAVAFSVPAAAAFDAAALLPGPLTAAANLTLSFKEVVTIVLIELRNTDNDAAQKKMKKYYPYLEHAFLDELAVPPLYGKRALLEAIETAENTGNRNWFEAIVSVVKNSGNPEVISKIHSYKDEIINGEEWVKGILETAFPGHDGGW